MLPIFFPNKPAGFVTEQWRRPKQTREREAVSERGLKGCFVAPSQHSSSWFFFTGLHMCCTFISKANLLVVELSNTHLTSLAHLNTPLPFFCSHFLPPLPPPCQCHPFFDNQGKATPCHFSAKAHEWLLQRRHGISCHMGDLISERFEENQLCFPRQSSTWWLLCPFKISLNWQPCSRQWQTFAFDFSTTHAKRE